MTLPQAFVLAWLVIQAHGHVQRAPAVPRQFTGTVVAVHDGDTISVRTPRETIRIRLEGIDCPEYRQPYSARAKQFTAELVHRKDVTVDGRGEDQYGRLLARVRVGGVEVNEALVRNGLAWHYQRGEIDPALAAAERAARAARVGLWADPNPVPPWRWRRDHPPVRGRASKGFGVGPVVGSFFYYICPGWDQCRRCKPAGLDIWPISAAELRS